MDDWIKRGMQEGTRCMVAKITYYDMVGFSFPIRSEEHTSELQSP